MSFLLFLIFASAIFFVGAISHSLRAADNYKLSQEAGKNTEGYLQHVSVGICMTILELTLGGALCVVAGYELASWNEAEPEVQVEVSETQDQE